MVPVAHPLLVCENPLLLAPGQVSAVRSPELLGPPRPSTSQILVPMEGNRVFVRLYGRMKMRTVHGVSTKAAEKA